VFDPTGSTDNEDPTSALQVRWDWENDGNWDTSWDTMQTSGVTFGAAGYGLQTIVLEVKDTGGLTDSTTGTVLIDHAPTAAFTVTPVSGDTNTVFQFDASNTTDPDYGVYWLSVRWDWEDDGTYDTGWDGATKIVEHTFSQPDTYTVRMEVRQFDGSLTDSTTRNVTVTQGISNTAPTAAFTVTPNFGYTNTTFQFDASASSDSEDPTSALQVRWDFDGDGSFDTNWSTGKTATHTYAAAGTYTVRLQLEDTGGLTNSTTRSISVYQPGQLIPVYLPLVGRWVP
jgi:PKD repeat protein